MSENLNSGRAAGYPETVPYLSSGEVFPEVRGKTSAIAIFLGMAIIAAAILLGRSYALYISVLCFSFLMTLIWRNAPRPWVFLASVAAATPIPLFRQEVACNLIFAVWLMVFNMRYLARLPRWIYILTSLAVMGLLTSSFNWLTGNIVGSLLRQSAYFFNFGLMPLLLVPMIYVRMSESRNHSANLQGLLFCLIIPTTLLLLSAKIIGKPANLWEASLHVGSLSGGYLRYQLGKVIVDFSRTGIGFILAGLICASTAIVSAQVKTSYRVLAGGCLASNVFLLLSTGSFGSITASVCGLAAIFFSQVRTIKLTKVFTSAAVTCCMVLLILALLPQSTRTYLGQRYEHRIVEHDTDRLTLWSLAVDYFFEHPFGVGLTYTVGDREKSNPHNEYLVYAVSYGFIGGLAYPSLVIGLLIYFFKNRKLKIDDSSALAICMAGLGVIIAYAINTMTDNVGPNRWYNNILWSLIWYCYFCSRAALNGPARQGMESEAVIEETGPSPDKSLPAYTKNAWEHRYVS